MEPGRIRLLLVEDNPGDSRLVREMLRGVSDIALEEVDRLDSAEAHLASAEVDIVLLDLALPDSQGLDTLARVRAHQPTLPVIVLTGLDDEVIALEAVKAGAQDYLVKGHFDEHLLPRAIRYAIERKRGELALLESEQKFRALAEASPFGIYAYREKFIYVNPAFTTLTGYAVAELSEMNYWELVHPEFRDLVRQRGAARLRGENVPDRYEIKLVRKDGNAFWISAAATTTRLGGEMTGIGICSDVTERKRAEEALRESEERYRTLFNGMPVGVYQTGKEGRILSANVALAALLGYDSPAELTGRLVDDFYVKAEDRLRWRLAVEREGVLPDAEIRLRRKDGSVIWVRDSGQVIRDDSGLAASFEGILSDITERKLAEEALRTSEHRYQLLVESMVDPVWLMDMDMRVTYISPSVIRARGFTLEETNAMPFEQQVTPDSLARATQLLSQALSRDTPGSPVTAELEFYRKDGTRYWSETSFVLIRDADGAPQAIMGVGRDITERKTAESALRESEANYRTIFEGIQDAIMVEGPNGEFLDVNQRACEMYGYTRQEFLAKTVRDVTPPGDEPLPIETLVRSSQEGRHLESLERRADGTVFPVQLSASVRTFGGNPRALIVARDITERKQTEERIRTQVETLEVLYELSRALSAMDDFNAILDLITRRAAESAHVTFACVLLLDQGDFVLRAAFPVRLLDQELQVGQREPLAAHPLFQSVLEGKASRVLESDSLEGDECAPFFRGVLRTLCMVPLYVHERPFGLLMLCETRSGAREPFTAEKLRLANSIGDQAVSSLQRGVLHEETVRQVGQLEALHRIDQAIAGSVDMRLTLNVVLEHVTSQLKLDAASALVLDPHSHTLACVAARGFRTGNPKHLRLRLGEGFAGRAALERKHIHVPDLRHRGTDILRSPFVVAEGFVSYHCVPLIAKGQVKGVLEVFHRAGRDDDAAWVNYLETLAGQAAIAIDSAELFENLERSNIGLTLAYDATIEGWSHALDLRDKETEGHTQRVTELTLHMARMAGLSEEELVHVRRGALLHDMGKLGVPDNILLKPGELTEAEWVLMRKHPALAYEMLSPIAYLRPALDIPYCHHEKWDGTGYPRGLKGEQIPIAARIFALADVFDALRSDRPYRPAWPLAKAIDHIRSLSGSHFDPNLLEPFLAEVTAG